MFGSAVGPKPGVAVAMAKSTRSLISSYFDEICLVSGAARPARK